MVEGRRNRFLGILFYLIFFVGFLAFSALNYRANFISDTNMTRFVMAEAVALFFVITGSLGVNKGIDNILSGYRELNNNPGALKINFYSQILAFGTLMAVISGLMTLVYLGQGFLAFILTTPLILIFLISTSLVSYISKGALVFHLVNGLDPGKAVYSSINFLPKYIGIEFYRHLLMMSGFIGGFLSEKILARKGVPEEIINGTANIALSYAVFYAVSGSSALQSVEESLRKSIEKPKKTAFLDIGIAMVVLLSTLLLIIPMGLFLGTMVLFYDSLGALSAVAGAIPFIIGIFFYLYLMSLVSTAGEIALMRQIYKS